MDMRIMSYKEIIDTNIVSEKEQKYLEQLQLTNKKLQQANDIIEKSSIVVFEWSIGPNLPAKFVTKNISIFGYTEDDFIKDIVDYWDFVYEPDREKTQRTVWEAREKNIDEYKHMYRVKCKNGEIRWVEEWVILDRDESGNPVSEKGVLRDITDQIETAEKLRQSEERYRSLFENACALICTFSIDGSFTTVNNACSDLTGYTREDLLNMNVMDILIMGKNPHINWNDITQAVNRSLNKNLEFLIKTKIGSELVLEGRVAVIYKDDIPMEVQVVAQDITARKVAEQRIHHLTFHDKLTGLYNRAYFDDELNRLDTMNEYPYSIIIGDMNGLKLANDAFGHKTGDRLLVLTAQLIEQACRKNDTIARLAGDEFAIILPGCSEEDVREVCDRIRLLCSKSRESTIQPSIALGYSTKTDCSKSIEEILREADDNMYRNKLNESRSIRSSIISSLQATLEEKTSETKEHSQRLKKLALKLGKAVGLSDSMLDELSIASVMHDIGKIAIPDNILMKSGKLTHHEWEAIKKHPEIGYNIILSSPRMATVAEYILAHHERWDGKGYPRNLKAAEIPIISRIIAIVDAYDVMTHNRVYANMMTKEEALEEIEKCSGAQFDPYLSNIFISIMK